MPTTILQIFIILLLCAVVYQDFKSKQVSLVLIVALFVNLLLLSFFHNGFKQALLFFFINILFTSIELLFIFIYLKLRKKINSFSELNLFFGWGDVAFLAAISLVFSPFNYILFTHACTLVCILFLAVSSLLSKKDISAMEVPYAGVLSLCLIFLFMAKVFICTFNFYDDLLLLHLLNE